MHNLKIAPVFVQFKNRSGIFNAAATSSCSIKCSVVSFPKRAAWVRIEGATVETMQNCVTGAVLVQAKHRARAIGAAVKRGAVEYAITSFEQPPGILTLSADGAEIVKNAIGSSILVQLEDGAIASVAPIKCCPIKHLVGPLDEGGVRMLCVTV